MYIEREGKRFPRNMLNGPTTDILRGMAKQSTNA